MKCTNVYNTKQKQEILDFIMTQDCDFCIKDIYSKLSGVGLTTIYRVINNLISEGQLDKIIKENNCAYYRYLKTCSKENHFYLRCETCGSMEHIDCDCIKHLAGHVLKTHDFILNNKKTILNGICSKCKRSSNETII